MTALRRRRVPRVSATLLTAAWLVGTVDAGAQVIESRTPAEQVELGARVHLQFGATSEADPAVPRSEFQVRRARIYAGARINEWIDGAAQIDFAGEGASARNVFMRLSFSEAFRLSFGQFKRPFDLFELTSSSDILVIERDGRISGYDRCPGVGGVCSYSRFTRSLAFASLDVGVLATGDLADGAVEYSASVTNGAGRNRGDENGAKSYSARVVWETVPGVAVGANAALHDYPDAAGQTAYAPALALDIELGDFAPGLHVQTGVVTGENWRNPDPSGTPSWFLAAQGIVAYRRALPGSRAEAIEPVARVSWGDAGGEAGGAGLLLTPGLVLHLQGRNKLAANIDVWRADEGDTAWALRAQTYLYF